MIWTRFSLGAAAPRSRAYRAIPLSHATAPRNRYAPAFRFEG